MNVVLGSCQGQVDTTSDGPRESSRGPKCARRDLGPTSTQVVFRIKKSLFKVMCDKPSTEGLLTCSRSSWDWLSTGIRPWNLPPAEPSMWRDGQAVSSHEISGN